MTKTIQVAFTCFFAFYALCTPGCVNDRSSYGAKLPRHKVETSYDGIVAHVLIPAGFSANKNAEEGFDEATPTDFLPFPGNWAEVIRPDDRSFHVLILTDALAKGSTLGINPVAVIQLDSAGVKRDIVIAVPVDSLLISVQITGLADLITDYEPIRYIIQTWFVNYRGFGAFEVVGWRDEVYARRLLSAPDR